MNILSYTLAELESYFQENFNKGRYHAEAIYHQAFNDGFIDPYALKQYQQSQKLLTKVDGLFDIELPEVKDSKDAETATKFVMRADDGLEFETVVIQMKNYKTLCVSTQVGCKMGCVFCETGKLGFLRNLTVHEIIAQVFYAKFILKENIRNIVFMGMGEPLDNYDNLMKSISIITEPRGLNFTYGNLTISTVGDVRGLNRLANEPSIKDLKLAISLHSAIDSKREQLMPINKRHNLNSLKNALLNYPLKQAGIFFIEYILIKDFNDSGEDAMALVEFLKGLRCKVNLIPYNTCSDLLFEPPTNDDINNFYSILEANGLVVIKRMPKGENLMAACGQLGNKELKRIKL